MELFFLGCWSGPVLVEHKYLEDKTCPGFNVQFFETDNGIGFRHYDWACESDHALPWQEYSYRLDQEGSLWKEASGRREAAIVGYVEDHRLHVVESLNLYMGNFFDVRFSEAEDPGMSSKIQWSDEFVRNNESYWRLSGELSPVECPDNQ